MMPCAMRYCVRSVTTACRTQRALVRVRVRVAGQVHAAHGHAVLRAQRHDGMPRAAHSGQG